MQDTNKPIKTAGSILFKDDFSKVLLVKHNKKSDQIEDTYGLPAGRLDENETEEEFAARELFEETGLKAKIEDLVKIPTIYKADIPRSDGSTKSFTYQTFYLDKYSGDIKTQVESVPEWIEVKKLNSFIF